MKMEENELRYRKECCNLLWLLEDNLRLVAIETKKFRSLVNDFQQKIDVVRPLAFNVHQMLNDLWHSACEMPDEDIKKSRSFQFVERISLSWYKSEAKIHSSLQGVHLVSSTNPNVHLREILLPMIRRISSRQAHFHNMMVWDSECSIRIREIFEQIIPQIMHLLNADAQLRHYVSICKTLPLLQKNSSLIDDFLRHVLCGKPPRFVDDESHLESPHVKPFNHVMQSLAGSLIEMPQREALCLTNKIGQTDVRREERKKETRAGKYFVNTDDNEVIRVGPSTKIVSFQDKINPYSDVSIHDLANKWLQSRESGQEEMVQVIPRPAGSQFGHPYVDDGSKLPYYLEFMYRWPIFKESSCSNKNLSDCEKDSIRSTVKIPEDNKENVKTFEACKDDVVKVKKEAMSNEEANIDLCRTRNKRMPLSDIGGSSRKRGCRPRRSRTAGKSSDQLLPIRFPQNKYDKFKPITD